MAPQDPVLLLHGMGCGPWVWSEVSPLLGVAAMPVHLAGHRGGVPLDPRSGLPAAEQMVDELERRLDRAGVDRAHVVGNSLGGWLALRLAERGRARSVLCLAPAGGWLAGGRDEKRLVARFVLGRQVARRVVRVPGVLQSAAVRRAVMHPVVSRPEAATRPTTYRFVRDLAQCQALDVAVGDPGTRRMRPIESIDVPTRIVWSGGDRVLTGHWAQQGYDALPATVETLPGVGHLPMLDDPAAIAALIRRQIGSDAVPCDRRTAD